MSFAGAGDGHDPGFLGKKPGQGDLCRCGPFLPGDLHQPLDQRLVGRTRLGGEARHHIAEIAVAETGLGVDGPR